MFFQINDVIFLSLNSWHVLSYKAQYLRTKTAKRGQAFFVLSHVGVLLLPTERRYHIYIARFKYPQEEEKNKQ